MGLAIAHLHEAPTHEGAILGRWRRPWFHEALDCYTTFLETIEKTDIKNQIGHRVVFEIFREGHDPPLPDLFEGI